MKVVIFHYRSDYFSNLTFAALVPSDFDAAKDEKEFYHRMGAEGKIELNHWNEPDFSELKKAKNLYKDDLRQRFTELDFEGVEDEEEELYVAGK